MPINTNRSVQIDSLLKVCECRVEQAFNVLQNEQQLVHELENKCKEITSSIQGLEKKLAGLDSDRPNAADISVEILQAEASARAIIERDLRKEVFYLQTAEKDVLNAQNVLESSREQWQSHQKKLESIQHLQGDYQVNEKRREQVKSDGAADEMGITIHHRNSNG